MYKHLMCSLTMQEGFDEDDVFVGDTMAETPEDVTGAAERRAAALKAYKEQMIAKHEEEDKARA